MTGLLVSSALGALGLDAKARFAIVGNGSPGTGLMVWLHFTDGLETSGFATLGLGKRAPLRAVMEALEAAAIEDSKPSCGHRSGIAAHLSINEARATAHAELIERDAFLHHWNQEMSGIHISDTSWPMGATVELESADPKLRVCMAGFHSSHYGCWHIGVSALPTLMSAARRAREEASASYVRHQIAKSCPEPSRNTVCWNHEKSKDKQISKKIAYLLSPKQSHKSPGHDRHQTEKTQYQLLPSRSPLVTVAKAKNSSLNEMSFGPGSTHPFD